MNRTAELDRLMRQHKLTARQVGRMVNRSAKTVRNWRSSADRGVPEHALEIIRARLAAQGATE